MISFCFKEISIEEQQAEILNLNNKKAFQNSDTKIIKVLCSFINDSIKSFKLFPSCLKEVEVIPIH